MTAPEAFLQPSAARPLPPRMGDDWAEVLAPDERLLWQGRPDGGFHIRFRHLGVSAVGLVVVALALALGWQGAAGLRAGAPLGGPVAATAAGALAFGLALALGPHIADMIRRRHMAYALTDRRALIETRLAGRALVAYPITAQSPLWLAATRPPSAYFAILRRRVRPMERMRRTVRAVTPVHVGFELVPEAARLHAMMRDIQEAQA